MFFHNCIAYFIQSLNATTAILRAEEKFYFLYSEDIQSDTIQRQ